MYNATLANSFDADYEIFYGSDAALMTRENKEHEKRAWLFKEVDSPMLGWEIYATKTNFYEETGIVLAANATKSVKAVKVVEQSPFANTSLWHALDTFLKNSNDVIAAKEDFISTYGTDDLNALNEAVLKAQKVKRPAAGYLEGFEG